MGNFDNPHPLGNDIGIRALMDKNEVQRFKSKPDGYSMPPCRTDSMIPHRVVQIRAVAKAKNPGEKDVGINPERREILGIGIQKDKIRAVADHLPCQNVSIGNNTPSKSESPQKARRRGWRRNKTGIGPEAVGPATEETRSDKA
jgi:hypothetical protein